MGEAILGGMVIMFVALAIEKIAQHVKMHRIFQRRIR